MLRFQVAPAAKPVGTYAEQNAFTEPSLEKLDFIAAAACAPVAPAQNGDVFSFRQELFCQPISPWGFARFHHSPITYTEYRFLPASGLKPTSGIKRTAHPRIHSIQL